MGRKLILTRQNLFPLKNKRENQQKLYLGLFVLAFFLFSYYMDDSSLVSLGSRDTMFFNFPVSLLELFSLTTSHCHPLSPFPHSIEMHANEQKTSQQAQTWTLICSLHFYSFLFCFIIFLFIFMVITDP